MKTPNYWKPKKIRLNLDSDRDGIVDHKDCRPFNPKYQHLSKTMKERIKKLPIYASPTSIIVEQREIWERMKDKVDNDTPDIVDEVASHYYARPLPHILSKEAKNTMAKKLFLSAVSKYPGIVSEIERTKPRKVIITSYRQPDRYMPKGWVSPQREVFIGPQTPFVSISQREKFAKSAYHELKHAQQLNKMSYKEALSQYPYYRDEDSKVRAGWQGLDKKEFEDIIEEYLEVPMEKEARDYSSEKMKEYHKGRKPTGKMINKLLS